MKRTDTAKDEKRSLILELSIGRKLLEKVTHYQSLSFLNRKEETTQNAEPGV